MDIENHHLITVTVYLPTLIFAARVITKAFVTIVNMENLAV
jgi:hypothetical protein